LLKPMRACRIRSEGFQLCPPEVRIPRTTGFA
jgi:hypothetical protein